MIAKLHELNFELLPHPSSSPDLAPSDYWPFADRKRMHQGKRFGSNEVISENEAYFEAQNKSSNKKRHRIAEKCYDQCIALEEDYVDE